MTRTSKPASGDGLAYSEKNAITYHQAGTRLETTGEKLSGQRKAWRRTIESKTKAVGLTIAPHD